MNAKLIPTTQIVVLPDRARKDFTGLGALCDSISKYGILHPIVVTVPREDGKVELIAGERRFRAALLNGLKEVPCTLHKDLDEFKKKEIELEENQKGVRKDLSWQEQAELIAEIDTLKRTIYGPSQQGKKTGWSQADTARSLGISEATVQSQVKIAKILKDRPDIAKAVENLPMTAAVRRAKQILDTEEIKAAQDAGALEVSHAVRLGDALELIKEVESESVDLLLTDPPYGVEEIEKGRGKKASVNMSYQASLPESANLNPKEVKELYYNILPQIARVLKPSSHFYIFFTIDLYPALRNAIKRAKLYVNPTPIVWDKEAATSPFRGYDYSPCYEMILHGCKLPKSRRLAKPCRQVLKCKPLHALARIHPFQKPPKLLRYFLKQSSDPGSLIFDPFAGSGETLIQAKELGRSALGFEKDATAFYSIQKRLVETKEKETESAD